MSLTLVSCTKKTNIGLNFVLEEPTNGDPILKAEGTPKIDYSYADCYKAIIDATKLLGEKEYNRLQIKFGTYQKASIDGKYCHSLKDEATTGSLIEDVTLYAEIGRHITPEEE